MTGISLHVQWPKSDKTLYGARVNHPFHGHRNHKYKLVGGFCVREAPKSVTVEFSYESY
jgi:hypothetical protein